jgi:L-malate glycosyltransferase
LIVIEQGMRHVTNYPLLAEQAVGSRRVALWGHGKNSHPESNRLAERLKALTSRHAHWWFAYTEQSADVVSGLGYPRDRITVVQNAFDTRALSRAVESLGDADVAGIRDRLGLTGDSVALFIGKLSREKRIDYVIAAGDEIRRTVPDFQLIVAGAGPDEGRLRELQATRPWVFPVGPQFGDAKANLLRVADILLVPSFAGLVVLDSFASGTPLVSSADLPHGPEISYLQTGVNGLLVADRGDPRLMGDAAAKLLLDDGRRFELASGCHAARETYTIEEMVSRFAEGVTKALAS